MTTVDYTPRDGFRASTVGEKPVVNINGTLVVFQKNHVIPTAVAQALDVFDDLAGIFSGGGIPLYDHRNFNTNGRWLAIDPDVAATLNQSAHPNGASHLSLIDE